jgi:putative flippase GtrA/SAM-dependent methyltransferase
MTAAGRAIIVIPAFEPGPALLDLVADLSADRRPIVVVDDGSSAERRGLFAQIAALPGVVCLSHAVNLGKGGALKTAFNHVLLALPADAAGVVTADADGQHLAADIRRVADRLEAVPDTLILGARGFGGAVPARSLIGNVVTRGVFRLLLGRRLADTQTGLRGIPRSHLAELLAIEAGGYEFELEVLVRATSRRWPIEEIPIATVYGSFARSHFDPMRDSLRVYFVFVRFAGLSLVTAAIDYSVFALAFAAGGRLLLATACARLVAGGFNFVANRRLAFRSHGAVAAEAARYGALVVALMFVSYALVTTLADTAGMSVYVAKLAAEGALFAASFALQNTVVFRDRGDRDGAAAAATDWDRYYERPARFAPLTRRLTERLLIRETARALEGAAPDRIVELGGGGSQFLAALRRVYPAAELVAVDTNARGLQLVERRLPGDARLRLVNEDVRTAAGGGADLVYSVGVIEHFDPPGTAAAIRAHFTRARPGGVVIVTFPTPTWLYRSIRALAEAAGIWAFPDERPLSIAEVKGEAARHGTVLRAFVHWQAVLTQAVVVARSNQ